MGFRARSQHTVVEKQGIKSARHAHFQQSRKVYGPRIQLARLGFHTYHPHVPVQVSLVKVRVRAQAAVVQSFLDLPVDVPSLVSIYEDASAAAGVTTTWVACGLSPDGVCSLSGTATY